MNRLCGSSVKSTQMANLLSSYVLVFIRYIIKKDILLVCLHFEIPSMGQWECGLTEWAAVGTLLISLLRSQHEVHLQMSTLCQVDNDNVMPGEMTGHLSWSQWVQVCVGEHIGAHLSVGRGAAKGQCTHRKLVLTAQLLVLPVQSLQNRQTLSLRWGSRLGVMFEIHIRNRTHAVKPKTPSSFNLPQAKWENHSHMSTVCASTRVAERSASLWMEN